MDEQQSKHDPREQEERSQMDVRPLHQAVIREMEDPRDGFSPTPVWLIFASFILVAWCGSYLALHNGGWRADNSASRNSDNGTAASCALWNAARPRLRT